MSMPATASALTGANQAVSASPATYQGYTLRETAGTAAAATVRIWDNPAAASGALLDVVELPANGSAQAFYPGGIRAHRGIYVEVVAGTVEGSVRIA
ncbi:hypothetical protein [Micromonospora sp. NPDC050200]|uniref:hypothetical protein n=1 Tax=Micromonospora sp. NPDC050200 TaxID=3155664 RepID=UPI0033CBAE12